MKKLVYLAGPITGCSYDGAVGWRERVKEELAQENIKALSPMRAKEYLEHYEDIANSLQFENQAHIGNTLSSARGIMTRDRFDALSCGVLFVNFLGAEVPSLGTVMEIAWADANRSPIIVVMEDEGNPHDHAMINEATGFRVNTLEQGIVIAKAILSDY